MISLWHTDPPAECGVRSVQEQQHNAVDTRKSSTILHKTLNVVAVLAAADAMLFARLIGRYLPVLGIQRRDSSEQRQ